MSLLKTSGWIVPLLLVIGCDGTPHEPAEKNEAFAVALPALTIIQNAVVSLVPTINGQRNDLMMRQVCALARGEASQDQVSQTLREQGIDLTAIAHKDHPMSLLINTDQSLRITACAAFVATSAMTLPKTSEFMVEAKTDTPESKNTKGLVIDLQKLNRFLGVQLAVAKADADLFALMATELEKTPGLTLAHYNQRAQSLFTALAPAYLQRVKELYASGINTTFKLLEYSDSEFKFSTSSGHLFAYGYDGLNFSLNRIPWYGEGKLLGKTYLLDVAYFDPQLTSLIEAQAGKRTLDTPVKP
ncbi:hypothetical protein [Pseudomonas sp. Xaverov 259]|uniref:hypothetical protein n=1 Tax=Pseudomonas sp. Xaverov 259 TaxID=2666086 RepID=UPI001C5B4BD8|nr:hypothetical protein [Pseudomonas sp. Xaverov 259]